MILLTKNDFDFTLHTGTSVPLLNSNLLFVLIHVSGFVFMGTLRKPNSFLELVNRYYSPKSL